MKNAFANHTISSLASIICLLAVLGCSEPQVASQKVSQTAVQVSQDTDQPVDQKISTTSFPTQSDKDTKHSTAKPEMNKGKKPMNETAILAGGCFWGMQELIRKMPGVISTRVGYSGGDVPNATYRNHGTHAEAIEVVFDPQVMSYRKLLEFFFQIHDPTTKNRQGNDRGMSYRSAIYYSSEEQKATALDTIADVNASGLWPGKVVTEVEPAGPFWEAEPEHQDYLQRIPNGYTCHFPRLNWVLPKRKTVETK